MSDDVERQLLAGLDLGKLSDHHAFSLFERSRSAPKKLGVQVVQSAAMGRSVLTPVHPRPPEKPGHRPWRYDLRRMDRWDVGTAYTDLSAWLAKAYTKPPDQGGLKGTTLVIDGTGVGVPMVEMIVQQFKRDGAKARIVPIWIGAGKNANEWQGTGLNGWTVPKRDLVSVLQVLFGTKRLWIDPRLPLANVLVKELDNFKSKMKEDTGHESFEAWREADHDDCVLACALPLWVGERAQKEFWIT